MDWKIHYMKQHKMLTQNQLAHEILSLVKYIDEEQDKNRDSNNYIVEALTLVSKSIL
jgi:hypothetical protein